MGTMDAVRSLAELAATRPIDQAPAEILLPPDDPDILGDGDFLGDAEGQSFLIEYIDSRQQRSRRRITVYSIRSGAGGIPLLMAKCHERKATRTFRVDRIVCCIDYDGEVHDDVPTYLHETFGMAIGVAAAKPSEADRRWEQIKGIISADAVLLSAISRADHHTHTAETDAATDHLCLLVERSGIFLTEEESKAIWRHVAKLRPGADAIARAVRQIADKGPDHIKRVVIAAVKVVDADGMRHPTERYLLNELSRDLLGITLL